MSGGAAAFLCYARFDDVHDDGQLSVFRERLAAEVRAQTGREFTIFQDRASIGWGENWRQRIEQTLDGVSFLLVVVTPGLFGSQACRGEIARFAGRERALGRSDLILPVYYISAREMEDPAVRDSDETAGLLAGRQFADWRELRFEPLASPAGRKAVAVLAARLRDTLHPGTDKQSAQNGDPGPQAQDIPAVDEAGWLRPALRRMEADLREGLASLEKAKANDKRFRVVWGSRLVFPSSVGEVGVPGDRIWLEHRQHIAGLRGRLDLYDSLQAAYSLIVRMHSLISRHRYLPLGKREFAEAFTVLRRAEAAVSKELDKLG